MRALLDVNMLIALFDPEHMHHSRAREWWGAHREQGWASCPLTQNGFLRVITSAGYRGALSMAQAIAALGAQTAIAGHEFWPDDVSLLDATVCDHSRILGPKQLTDIYLLALAVKHGGRLVTFDRAIPLNAVCGAEAKHIAAV